MKKFFILFLFCAVFLSPSSLRSFSIQDEIKLGKKFKKFITLHFSFVKDPYITNYVNRVLRKITSKVPDLPFKIKLYVLKDPSVNAFAAPAGYVFVNSGLIMNMNNEDQLAAILAHELAHVRQRHLAKNIERSRYLTAAGLVGILAGILIGNPELSKAISMSSIAGVQTAALKYSRENERDADKLGLEFLIRAGYSPYGMIQAFERIKHLMKLSGVITPPPYMLTHPGLEERIEYIKDMIEYLSKKHHFKQPKKVDVSYLEVKVLTEARYGKNPYVMFQNIEHQEKVLRSDFCVLQLGKLIICSRLGEFNKAERIVNSKCFDPHSSLWNREVGIYYFLTKSFNKAEFYLKKAVESKPEDIIAVLFLARTLKYLGDYDLAISYLKRILIQDSTNREVHLVLSQIFGEKRDLFKGYLHLAYFYLYSGVREKSLLYYKKAESIATSPEQKFLLKKFKVAYKRIF